MIILLFVLIALVFVGVLGAPDWFYWVLKAGLVSYFGFYAVRLLNKERVWAMIAVVVLTAYHPLLLNPSPFFGAYYSPPPKAVSALQNEPQAKEFAAAAIKECEAQGARLNSKKCAALMEENRQNALALKAQEIRARRESKPLAVSEQWAETLNFELPASMQRVEAPEVSVSDVSPGWGVPGTLDEHMAVLWRRSTFAREAAATANGIGVYAEGGSAAYGPSREDYQRLTEEYGLDPRHPSFQIMGMARSPEQLEKAAQLVRRNMDQDGYAAQNYNGVLRSPAGYNVVWSIFGLLTVLGAVWLWRIDRQLYDAD